MQQADDIDEAIDGNIESYEVLTCRKAQKDFSPSSKFSYLFIYYKYREVGAKQAKGRQM